MTDKANTSTKMTTLQICDLLKNASAFEIYAEHNQVYHGTVGSQRVDESNGDLYVKLSDAEYCIAFGISTFNVSTHVNGVTSVKLKSCELVLF